MSANSGIGGKGDKNKDRAAFKSVDINNKFKGKTLDTQKPNVSRQHGLQTLGKIAGTNIRRMPMPANLPSLKAENSGNDPTVNLVPSGSGWGAAKKPASPALGESQAAPESRPAPQPVAPLRGVAAQASSASSNNGAGGPSQGATGAGGASAGGARLWSSVTQGTTTDREAAAQGSPRFQKDFPSLGDEKGKDAQEKAGGEPNLRPQFGGSWRDGGSRNVQQYEREEQRGGSPPVPGPSVGGAASSSVTGASHLDHRGGGAPPMSSDPGKGFIPQRSKSSGQSDNRNGSAAGANREGAGSAFSRPPVVNKKRLEDLVDTNDNGGWANSSGEVDYTAKLIFSDEEDEEPSKPPPMSSEPPKKAPQPAPQKQPPKTVPASSSDYRHSQRPAKSEVSDKHAPPSARDNWRTPQSSSSTARGNNTRVRSPPRQAGQQQPSRRYDGLPPPSHPGPPPPRSAPLSSRTGPPLPRNMGSFPGGGSGGGPFPGGGADNAGHFGGGPGKMSQEFGRDENALRRHEARLAVERGRQKRERVAGGGGRPSEDDQQCSSSDAVAPPRDAEASRPAPVAPAPIARQDSGGPPAQQRQQVPPSPVSGQAPPEPSRPPGPPFDMRYPMPVPQWMAAGFPPPPPMPEEADRDGKTGGYSNAQADYHRYFQDYMMRFYQMGPMPPMPPGGAPPMGQPLPVPSEAAGGMVPPPVQKPRGPPSTSETEPTPPAGSSEQDGPRRAQRTEPPVGSSQDHLELSRKRPLEPKQSARRESSRSVTEEGDEDQQTTGASLHKRDGGRAPVPISREAQKGMTELKSNLVTLTRGAHYSTSAPQPKDSQRGKPPKEAASEPRRSAWANNTTTAGPTARSTDKNKAHRGSESDMEYKQDRRDRHKMREKSEEKPPSKKSREEPVESSYSRSSHLGRQERGGRGRGAGRGQQMRGGGRMGGRGSGSAYREWPAKGERSEGSFESQSEFGRGADRRSSAKGGDRSTGANNRRKDAHPVPPPAQLDSKAKESAVDVAAQALGAFSLSGEGGVSMKSSMSFGQSEPTQPAKLAADMSMSSKPEPAPIPQENIWEKRKQEQAATEKKTDLPKPLPSEPIVFRAISQDYRPEAHNLKMKSEDEPKPSAVEAEGEPATRPSGEDRGPSRPAHQDHRQAEQYGGRGGGRSDRDPPRRGGQRDRRGEPRGDYRDNREGKEYREGPGKREGGPRGSRDGMRDRPRDGRPGQGANRRGSKETQALQEPRGGAREGQQEYTGERGQHRGSYRGAEGRGRGGRYGGGGRGRGGDNRRPPPYNRGVEDENGPTGGNGRDGEWDDSTDRRQPRSSGARGQRSGRERGRGGKTSHAAAVSTPLKKPFRTRTESGTDGGQGDQEEWETASESSEVFKEPARTSAASAETAAGAASVDKEQAIGSGAYAAPSSASGQQKKGSANRNERRPESKKYSASERHQRGDRTQQPRGERNRQANGGKSDQPTSTAMRVDGPSNVKAMQAALSDMGNKKTLPDLADFPGVKEKENKKPTTQFLEYDVNNVASVVIIDDQVGGDVNDPDWEDDDDGFQKVVSKKAQQRLFKAQAAQLEEENARKLKREKDAQAAAAKREAASANARVRQHSGQGATGEDTKSRYPLPPRLVAKQKEKDKQKREKERFKIDCWDNDMSKGVSHGSGGTAATGGGPSATTGPGASTGAKASQPPQQQAGASQLPTTTPKAIPSLMSQSINPTEDLLKATAGAGMWDAPGPKAKAATSASMSAPSPRATTAAATTVPSTAVTGAKADPQDQHDSGVDINDARESVPATVASPEEPPFRPAAHQEAAQSAAGGVTAASLPAAPSNPPEDNQSVDPIQLPTTFTVPKSAQADNIKLNFGFDDGSLLPKDRKAENSMEGASGSPPSPGAADLNQKIGSCKPLWDSTPIPGIPTPPSFAVPSPASQSEVAQSSFAPESQVSPGETSTNVCMVKPQLVAGSDPVVSLSSLSPSGGPATAHRPSQSQQASGPYQVFVPNCSGGPSADTQDSGAAAAQPSRQFPTFTPPLAGHTFQNVLVQPINNPPPPVGQQQGSSAQLGAGGSSQLNPLAEVVSFPGTSQLYPPQFSAPPNAPETGGLVGSTSSIMSTSIKPSTYGGSFQPTANAPFDQTSSLGQPSVNQPAMYVHQYDPSTQDMMHQPGPLVAAAQNLNTTSMVPAAAASMFGSQYTVQSRQAPAMPSSLYSQQQPARPQFYTQGGATNLAGGAHGGGFPAVLAPSGGPMHLNVAMPSGSQSANLPLGAPHRLVGQAGWSQPPQAQAATNRKVKMPPAQQQPPRPNFQPASQATAPAFGNTFDQSAKWSTDQDKNRKPFLPRDGAHRHGAGPPGHSGSGPQPRQSGLDGPMGGAGAIAQQADANRLKQQQQQSLSQAQHPAQAQQQRPNFHYNRPANTMRYPAPIQRPHQQKKHQPQGARPGPPTDSEKAQQRAELLKITHNFCNPDSKNSGQAIPKGSSSGDSLAFLPTPSASLSSTSKEGGGGQASGGGATGGSGPSGPPPQLDGSEIPPKDRKTPGE